MSDALSVGILNIKKVFAGNRIVKEIWGGRTLLWTNGEICDGESAGGISLDSRADPTEADGANGVATGGIILGSDALPVLSDAALDDADGGLSFASASSGSGYLAGLGESESAISLTSSGEAVNADGKAAESAGGLILGDSAKGNSGDGAPCETFDEIGLASDSVGVRSDATFGDTGCGVGLSSSEKAELSDVYSGASCGGLAFGSSSAAYGGEAIPGASEFTINILTLNDSGNVTLRYVPTSSTVIDWGNGSRSLVAKPSMANTAVSITYPYGQTGEFTIKISGGFAPGENGSNKFFKSTDARLTAVRLGDGVTRIRGEAFSFSSQETYLTTVELGGITSMYNESGNEFVRSGVKSVVIPDTVVGTVYESFYSCAYLEEIIIGCNVSALTDAFRGCSSLKKIICLANTPPALSANEFTGVPSTCDIYVPELSVNAYKAASRWSTRSSRIKALS